MAFSSSEPVEMTMVLHFQQICRISPSLKLQSNLISLLFTSKSLTSCFGFTLMNISYFPNCRFSSSSYESSKVTLLAALMLTETVNFSVFLPEALYLSGQEKDLYSLLQYLLLAAYDFQKEWEFSYTAKNYQSILKIILNLQNLFKFPTELNSRNRSHQASECCRNSRPIVAESACAVRGCISFLQFVLQ